MSVLKELLTIWRLPHLGAHVRTMRDVTSFLRIHFVYAAKECGLLGALKTPASAPELLSRLAVKRPDLLQPLLDLGLSLKELSFRGQRYRLRGRRRWPWRVRMETLSGRCYRSILPITPRYT